VLLREVHGAARPGEQDARAVQAHAEGGAGAVERGGVMYLSPGFIVFVPVAALLIFGNSDWAQ
jgi:hypothetical protein